MRQNVNGKWECTICTGIQSDIERETICSLSDPVNIKLQFFLLKIGSQVKLRKRPIGHTHPNTDLFSKNKNNNNNRTNEE